MISVYALRKALRAAYGPRGYRITLDDDVMVRRATGQGKPEWRHIGYLPGLLASHYQRALAGIIGV